MVEIKHILTGEVLRTVRADTLRGANLTGADLYGADLRGADLCGVNLYRADLYGADLCGVNLYGADLYGANLTGADLTGADLTGADLYGAVLYGAKVGDALLHKVLQVGPVGSRSDYLVAWFTDKGLLISTGCQNQIARDEFVRRVEETHGDSKYGREYRAVLAMLDAMEVSDE